MFHSFTRSPAPLSPKRLLGAGVIAAVAASMLVAAPAQAVTKPEGSQVHVLFGSSDPATSLSRSVTWDGVDFTVTAGTTAEDFGCPTGDRLAAAMTDPSRDGSTERPVIADSTVLARDVFTWTLQTAARGSSPAAVAQHANTPGTSLALPFNSRTKFYTKDQSVLVASGGADASVVLASLWATGTTHSVVVFCTSGVDATTKQYRVSQGADGRAISSWVQFSTLANPEIAAETSTGFEVVDPKVTPTVSLAGSVDGSTGTLTVTLTGPSGAALTDALGTVDFYNGEGTAGTKAGTAEVSAAGTASLSIPGLESGSHVYTAVYTPSSAAGATYSGATSSPFALIVAEKAVATVSTTLSSAHYGTAASAKIAVSTPGGAASGAVTVSVDGTQVAGATLVSGAAKVALPKALKVGTHEVTVAYAGNGTTKAASATSSLKVARAISTVSLSLSKSTAHKKKTVIKAKVAVKVSGVTPSGKVTIKVGSKTVKTATLSTSKKGKITISLPKFTKTGKQKVTASFSTTSTIAGDTSPSKTVTVKK